MNKSQIRTQFLALANRNDCSNELADTFLEQSLARIQRTLRVPSMERGNLVTTNVEVPDSIVLPEDFLSMKYVYSGDTLLEYVDIGRFLRYAVQGGSPTIYTRIQGEIKLKPAPATGTAVTLIYYGEFEDFTTDTSVNYLSVAAPDLLIYGALSYAADFFLDERKPLFEQTFTRIYDEIVEQALLTEMSTSGMAIGTPFDTEY